MLDWLRAYTYRRYHAAPVYCQALSAYRFIRNGLSVLAPRGCTRLARLQPVLCESLLDCPYTPEAPGPRASQLLADSMCWRPDSNRLTRRQSKRRFPLTPPPGLNGVSPAAERGPNVAARHSPVSHHAAPAQLCFQRSMPRTTRNAPIHPVRRPSIAFYPQPFGWFGATALTRGLFIGRALPV